MTPPFTRRPLLAALLPLLAAVPAPAAPQQPAASASLFVADGAGGFAEEPSPVPLRPSYHRVVAGSFDNTIGDELLFYDRVLGTVAVMSYPAGGPQLIRLYSGWSTAVDQVVVGDFDASTSQDDVLFYEAGTGIARFYTGAADGQLTLLRTHTGWQEWDAIIAGQFGGDARSDLFLYSRTRGEGKFFTTDGAGNITLLSHHTALNRNWDQIVAGSFNGDGITDLFFYQRVLGIGRTYATDGNGLFNLLRTFHLRTSWDLVVGGAFGGTGTDLFFYDRTAGDGRVSLSDGSGGLINQPLRAMAKSWFTLVPGALRSRGRSDLFALDNTLRLRIHAVRCEDDDGGRAALIRPSQVHEWVDRANVTFAAAGVRVEFDERTDYEVLRNTVINSLDLCSVINNQTVCDARKAAASAWAAQHPCKIVTFFRHGHRTGASGSGFSSETANYVALPGFDATTTTSWFQDPAHPGHGATIQGIKLLAHEFGHYFGLDHTFVTGIDYDAHPTPHAAVLAYLPNNATLDHLDGDNGEVFDTPPDVKIDYFLGYGWNPADLTREITIQSTARGIDLTFNPDRHNVMSYFGVCDDYLRVSPDQVRKVREVLLTAKAPLAWLCAHHVPGHATSSGSSCPGTGGVLPVHDIAGVIEIAQPMSFEVSNSVPSTNGAMLIGATRTRIPLDVIGMAGCFLYTDPFLTLPFPTRRTGDASVPITVPAERSLILATLYSQALIVDFGAPTPLKVVSTNSMSFTIGGDR